MNGTYTERTRVRYRDCDRGGKVKLLNWFDYLQEAAANHANELGCGYNQIVTIGKIWVLSRLRLEISGCPQVGDELEVLTYPTPFRRLFAERQFKVSAADGSELARASSEWLFLDSSTLRPVRLDRLPEPLPDNSELQVWFEFGSRLAPLERNASQCRFTVAVRPSMEDVNDHLNNAEYAGFVQDCLTVLHPAAFRVTGIELVWHLACRTPEVIEIGGALAPDNSFQIAGWKSDGALSFAASGRLTTINA